MNVSQRLIEFVLLLFVLQSTISNKVPNLCLIISHRWNLFGRSLIHIALCLYSLVLIHVVVNLCVLLEIFVWKFKWSNFSLDWMRISQLWRLKSFLWIDFLQLTRFTPWLFKRKVITLHLHLFLFLLKILVFLWMLQMQENVMVVVF